MGEKRIFISHSSKDSLYVKGIVEMLKDLGLSYWKAPEMIPPGSNYAKEIPAAIRECDVFLLVVSQASQRSLWVEKELDSAVNNRKMILPIKLDKEPLNDLFRFYLNNVQMISYDVEREKLMDFLLTQLGDKAIPIKDEAGAVTNEESKKAFLKRHGALSMNKAPVECRFCKGAIQETSRGVFDCLVCGKKSYDYYQTVRRYLERNGAASAIEIERATGIPRKAIDYLLKEEYLEISSQATFRLTCTRCGTGIRTGTLCIRSLINCSFPKLIFAYNTICSKVFL